MQAAGGAIEFGLELATAKYNDRRQLRQQRKLQELQIQGQKEMGEFNQQQALDLWDKTNYAAQREQLKKAGLNPGLLYGMSGGGGATANATPGNVSGANAPNAPMNKGMGLELGLAAAQTQAQIQLTKAQTEKTQAETAATQGETAPVQQQMNKTSAEIENIKQQTENAKVQQALTQWQSELTKLQTELQSKTNDDIARTINAGADKVIQEAEQAKNATPELKKQVAQATIEQATRIALQKAQIQQTEAQISKMASEVWNIYNQANNENRKISQRDQEILLEKARTEFQTNDVQKLGQVVDIWRTVLDGINNSIRTIIK